MDIDFTGVYTENENFGINFQAKLDGENITCSVTTEALQDINPRGKLDPPRKQYLDNQSQFELIARKKILNREGNKILITTEDL